ncbi:MAG: hypothetical protein IJK18_08650 [Clostridia bacterium]|nr:hypothetical protein [Clostridia bacterium]
MGIRFINNGKSGDVDLHLTTAMPTDVKKGKKYYNKSGQLINGLAPSVVINYADISDNELNIKTLDRSVITNYTRFYKNYMFGTNPTYTTLYAQNDENNILASIELEVIDINIEPTTLIIGGDGVIKENSILFLISKQKIADLYMFDYSSNKFTYLKRITIEDAVDNTSVSYSFNPYRNLLAVTNNGRQFIYRINNDFSITKVYENNLDYAKNSKWLSAYRIVFCNDIGAPKYYLDFFENDTYSLTTHENTDYSSNQDSAKFVLAISPNCKYVVRGVVFTDLNKQTYCSGNVSIYSCSKNAIGEIQLNNEVLNLNLGYYSAGYCYAYFVDDYTVVIIYHWSTNKYIYICKCINGIWSIVVNGKSTDNEFKRL